MPTLHELFAASIDERALRYAVDDPGARPETLRRIRTVRRRHTLATGTTSAIAVSSGFFVAAQGDNGLTSPADAPADATGDVVIDLANLSPFPTLSGLGPDAACGVSIADVDGAASDSGFTLETTWLREGPLDVDGGYAQVRAAVTYDGEPRPPAFVDTGYAVIVSEGTVVALVAPDPQPRFERLDRGAEWVDYVTVHGGADTTVWTCEGDALKAGDYELYVISQVGITDELLARQLLAEQGVVLEPDNAEAWVPGSEACDREARYPTSGARVLQCQPELAPQVELDLDNATARLTYAPELYAGDLNVQLVSAPLRLTIEAPAGVAATDPGVDEDADANHEFTTRIECEIQQEWQEKREQEFSGPVVGDDGTIRYDGNVEGCDGLVIVQVDPDGRTVSVIEAQ